MKKRYYVVAVQYNKEVNAENRTVPPTFDSEKKALQYFFEQLGKDMKNTTLGWSVVYVFDNDQNIVRSEKWVDEEWAAAQEKEETEPAEDSTVSK